MGVDISRGDMAPVPENAKTAFEVALRTNATLKRLCGRAIQRNCELPMLYMHLTALARGSAMVPVKEALGKTDIFRNVFNFFMPPGAVFQLPRPLAVALACEDQLGACGGVCADDDVANSLCQDGLGRIDECLCSPMTQQALEPMVERAHDEGVDAEKRESLVEAENADIAQAIIESRCNAPPEGLPLSDDGVVVLRLKSKVRTQKVAQVLSGSPLLADCHARVAESGGCQWSPAWLFVPITQDQICEAGLELKDHHIVCLKEDIENIRAALKEIRCTDRPGLTVPDVEVEQYCALRTFSSFGTPPY